MSYEFPPFVEGGAGTYAGLIYDGLVKRGHDVRVVTHGKKNEDGHIFRLNTPEIKYWRRVFFTYYAGKKINEIYEKEKIDIVHYNEPHIILSKPDIPTVSTFHSTQMNELFTKLNLSKLISTETIIETLIKSPIGSIGDLIASRKSDKIICVNNHLKHMISKYCLYDNNLINVIHNGIEVEEGNTETPDQIVINNEVLNKNKYLLYVGRLDPIKGIEYLIYAFKELSKEYDLKLVIVGTGFYESYLKKISNNKDIIFTGYVSDKKILSNLYKNSLMVILPSLYEGLPMVLLEAMSHGKPVIASRVGGIPEVVIEGKNGFLVAPGNPHQIYDKMKYLINDERKRREIGLHNISHIEKNFTTDVMIEKTLHVYEELLNKCN